MQKIHLKFHFSQQKVSDKILWKIRKLSTKDWMQLTLLSPCLTIIGMPYMGFWARKVRQNNSCPLKKPGFSYVFAKNSLAKRFCKPKFSARSITTLSIQLSNKQTDSTNAFPEIERQSWETQWALWNINSVSRNFKIFSSFSDENSPKNRFGKNYQGTPFKWMVFHRLVRKD